MSFILDALKKLEQQRRQRNSIPDITTLHSPAPHPPERSRSVQYILIAALVLNAVALLLITPWMSRNTGETPSTAQRERVSRAPAIVNDKDVTETVDSRAEETQTHHPSDVRPEKTEGPPPETTDSEDKPPFDFLPSGDRLNALKNQIRQERATMLNRVKAPIAEPEIKGRGIQGQDNAPEEIADQFKDIKITGHIFSDNPDHRLVNINGTIYREGDSLSNGLILKEITPDGVMFEYRGKEFLKKVH